MDGYYARKQRRNSPRMVEVSRQCSRSLGIYPLGTRNSCFLSIKVCRGIRIARRLRASIFFFFAPAPPRTLDMTWHPLIDPIERRRNPMADNPSVLKIPTIISAVTTGCVSSPLYEKIAQRTAEGRQFPMYVSIRASLLPPVQFAHARARVSERAIRDLQTLLAKLRGRMLTYRLLDVSRRRATWSSFANRLNRSAISNVINERSYGVAKLAARALDRKPVWILAFDVGRCPESVRPACSGFGVTLLKRWPAWRAQTKA